MGCFDNAISFKGKCDSTEPTSGLWTDHFGLHKTEIEKYIQTPYNNAEEFFNDMLEASLKEIEHRIYNRFLPTYKAASIINYGRIGQYADIPSQLAASLNKQRGIEVELCNWSSPINFYLSEFSLYCDVSETKTINVYDLQQNKLIDSFTITTVANQITTTYPNKTYKANQKKLNLAFLFDVSVTDQYNTTINNGCNNCTKAVMSSLNNWISARGVEFASSADKIQTNVTSLGHTAGISLTYSVNCNHYDWICNNANALALPLLHRTIASVLNYGVNSTDRENYKTNEDRERVKKRMDMHMFSYNEQIDNILNYMQPPNDPVCYQCNNRIKGVVHLPS